MSKNEGSEKSKEPTDVENNWLDSEDINKKRLRVLASINGGWRVRDCQDYKYEYSNCSKVRNRLQAYYLGINGTERNEDCNQWKDNYDDCQKFLSTADHSAVERIVEREGKRLGARLKGHLENDVWERRSEPPENWNAPLPEYLKTRADMSYLKRYKQQLDEPTLEGAKNLRAAKVQGYIQQMPLCTIM